MQGWGLPEEFATLRRLMEARMNRHGRREYVQVLRLLETFDLVVRIPLYSILPAPANACGCPPMRVGAVFGAWC